MNVHMKTIRKTILIAGITSLMLCSTAFAIEIDVTPDNINSNDAVQSGLQENIQSAKQEVPEIIKPEVIEKGTVRKGIVTVDILNVRSGSSTQTEILGKLSLGTTVDILAEADGWYEINYESKKAYLFGEYIRIIDSTLSQAQYTGLSIVDYAKTFIGTPYAYGGNTPKGFDCSGYVQYVMANFGVIMPRTSTEQYSIGARVAKSELLPGDLVFFKYSKSSYRLNHVGIYVGDGNFIHSPVPGQSVKISSLTSGYFSYYYYGATRVVK